MTKKVMYSWDDIEHARVVLQGLKNRPPPSKKTSNRDKIVSLNNELSSLRLGGWSWEEIALVLNKNNIPISIEKLKEYTELKEKTVPPPELTSTERLVEEYRHIGTQKFIQLLSELKKSELVAYVKALSTDFRDNKLKRMRKDGLVDLVLSRVKKLSKSKEQPTEQDNIGPLIKPSTKSGGEHDREASVDKDIRLGK